MEKKIKQTKVKSTKVASKSKVVKETKATNKEVALNPLVWNAKYNVDLVTQVLNVQLTNSRIGAAHAKSRADVQGGGRKPWKQKGTGRARAGSTRSPIWVGGGVTFVPNNRNWEKKINKKMVTKAICSILSKRLADNDIEFVSLAKDKGTKVIRESITNNYTGKLLVISDATEVKRGFSNVKTVDYSEYNNFSVLHIVKARKVIIDKDVISKIEERLVNGK